MADERPTDALQPSGKRRATGQATKDDPDSDEEDSVQDPGAWKPVDAEIAKRRKVKVRRAGAVEPNPVAEDAKPSAGNPFAGIALAAPGGANPFAGFNLVSPAAVQGTSSAQPEPEKAEETAAATPADTKSAQTPTECQNDAKEPTDKDAKEAGSTTPGFGSFASGSNPFAALTSSSKSGGGGFGGFGGFSTSQPSKPNDTPTTTPAFTPLFGSTPKGSGFSFGTSAFPSIVATPKSGAAADDGEEADEANVELFNDSTAEFRPVMQLPDQKTVTGEEEESVVFTADSTLYEFEPATSHWKERGKGEFRLNLDKAGQARMVMRQTGNYRLLMNAKVYSGMAVHKMAGDVGVTFACANASAAADQSTDKKEASPASGTPGGESASKLATWALKIRSKDLVMRLLDMLGQAAGKAATPPSAT